MRFDDMLATALAQVSTDDPASIAASWRQLADLLAQGRGGAALEEAYAFLGQHRDALPIEFRRDRATAMAGPALPARLVEFFAADHPAVAAPVLRAAVLDVDGWLAILPRLSPTARALLRHRDDLVDPVKRGLAQFGSADLLVEGPPADASGDQSMAAEDEPAAEQPRQPSQIREILSRIEAFRRARGEPGGAEAEWPPAIARPIAPPPSQEFRFETDVAGVVAWLDGADRGALIGQSIAMQATAGEHGVDGQAAGAFRRRAPFRNARLSVAGSGRAAGEWRLSAVPFFDPADGRFMGYRGSGRRPRPDETAAPPSGSPLGTGLSPESIRQLTHELRTPLGAISGFAQMIEGQVLGPAPTPYRARASEIAGLARRLLAAVDDLDTAARIDGDGLSAPRGGSDGRSLIERFAAEYGSMIRERGVELRIGIADGLPAIDLQEAYAERMFGRLATAVIGMAGPGEVIAIALEASRGSTDQLVLAITRPRALRTLSEAELLDPGYTPEGDFPDAPALGLGFALRLVRNLARNGGGALDIAADALRLRLPARDGLATTGQHGS